MEFILLIFLVPALFVAANFLGFISNGQLITPKGLFGFMESFTVFFAPVFFLFLLDVGEKNDCCSDSAVFSPAHRLTVYVLILLCMIAYAIAMLKGGILTPIAELLLNSILIAGLIINILLCFHLHTKGDDFIFWLLGNVPIILLFLMKLSERHILIRDHIVDNELTVNSWLGEKALKILQFKPLLRYPVLLLLVIPVVSLLALLLLVFGQKPDSIIRAFTDTYKHGLSQLDYQCENVQCGGHFLCSVGANGHKRIVKPTRLGERNGQPIICTRQLLVSNAFEDLLQEKLPRMHRFIRQRYNKVGAVIHRYYGIFEIKIVSDAVYFLMKPLEWVFVVVLYTFDQKPENRIHKQYLSRDSRQLIDQQLYS